jgi:hypothetical protein
VTTNSITWSDLNLTGLALPIPTQTSTDGEALYQIVTGIVGDFTLSGFITLNFSNLTRPDGSQLAFRIAAFNAPDGGGGNVIFPNPVPVPAALALFGVGLLALAGLSARRRA